MSYADYCGINTEPQREPCPHLRSEFFPRQGRFCVECGTLLYGAPTPVLIPTAPADEPIPF